MPDASPKPTDDPAGWKLSLVVSAGILLVAGGLVFVTFSTEPSAEKGGATKRTAMLVDVVEVERDDHHPRIVAQGTVEPARDIVLRPQVGGRVNSVTSAFVPGGFVDEGELLLRIESEDYEHDLAQKKSELRQAETDLAIERGRHQAAKGEYDRFGEELPPDNKALVVREPQLEAARERLEAAKAAVEQAELDLRRTTLEAPFDGHILRRDANVGSQISPSEDVGRLVGTETYWVGVDLPLSKLRWVTIDEEAEESSRVRIRNKQAWPEGTYRSGHLFKKIGALDEDTRMVRILAAIPDPLARDAEDDSTPPLTIGEFVEASIRGDEIEDVVRLDRDYVRDGDTVWVMENGELQIEDVEIAVRDAEYAYIRDGLDEESRVVTTSLTSIREGAPLRLNETGGETNGE